jgi:hypothetical protein
VVRDGLADHWRESYVCETGKSMKAVDMKAVELGGVGGISCSNSYSCSVCKHSATFTALTDFLLNIFSSVC